MIWPARCGVGDQVLFAMGWTSAIWRATQKPPDGGSPLFHRKETGRIGSPRYWHPRQGHKQWGRPFSGPPRYDAPVRSATAIRPLAANWFGRVRRAAATASWHSKLVARPRTNGSPSDLPLPGCPCLDAFVHVPVAMSPDLGRPGDPARRDNGLP